MASLKKKFFLSVISMWNHVKYVCDCYFFFLILLGSVLTLLCWLEMTFFVNSFIHLFQVFPDDWKINGCLKDAWALYETVLTPN